MNGEKIRLKSGFIEFEKRTGPYAISIGVSEITGFCTSFVCLVECSAKPQELELLLHDDKLKSPTIQIAINTNLFIC